jgi:hypothetical protein
MNAFECDSMVIAVVQRLLCMGVMLMSKITVTAAHAISQGYWALYTCKIGLVDVQPPTGLCQPAARTTRGNQQKLQVPHSRTDVCRHSFFPSAIRIWNALKEDIVELPSLPAFQSAAQGWLKAR